MGKIKIFLDTDVLISSLLSKSGASYELIFNANVIKIISNTVKMETIRVAKCLNIHSKTLIQKMFKNLKIIASPNTKEELIKKFQKYVLDDMDSHVVAEAFYTKAGFLLTHNIRHFNCELIKRDFGIIVTKPGNFLQYLRSINFLAI